METEKTMRTKTRYVAGTLLLLLVAGANGLSQQTTPPPDNFVTREEYNKLLKELNDIKAQLQHAPTNASPAEVEALRTKVQALEKKQESTRAETDQSLEEMDKSMKSVKDRLKGVLPGSTHMLLTGDAAAQLNVLEHTGGTKNSLFSAAFGPVFLWELNDQLFFHGETVFKLNNQSSELQIELEQARLSYLLNDYMTLEGGEFLNPADIFFERLHKRWIDKFPDQALAVGEPKNIMPPFQMGGAIRGGVPIGSTKFEYVAFVANAPELITADTNDPFDPLHSKRGQLSFDNTLNIGNHVAFGGHLGFFPIPELEIGYGIQYSEVGNSDVPGVTATIHEVDAHYVQDIPALKGLVEAHGAWAFSHVSDATYSGGVTFRNDRNGGYVDLGYQPTRLENAFLQKLEPVVRFDMLNQPKDAPGGFDEHRWTVGLDYWITPRAVVKTAYEFDHQDNGHVGNNAFLLQFAMGF